MNAWTQGASPRTFSNDVTRLFSSEIRADIGFTCELDQTGELAEEQPSNTLSSENTRELK